MNDALLLKISDLEFVEDADENELLEGAAGGIAALIPDYDPLDEIRDRPVYLGNRLLAESVVGALKKKFDEALHPRWPKGTPRAGEFMRKGQVFEADGKKWQIINTVRGSIEAIEASGETANVEHRIFKAKSSAVQGKGVGIPGAKPAELKFTNVSTAKASGAVDVDVNSPIVVPYVEPDTHDPSIKPHEESPLNATQWKRFGREDQLYYNEIMERFGKWSASKGQSLFKQLYKEYDKAAISGITNALSNTISEYSQSGQKVRLNLASLLASKGWEGEAGYENAKVTFDEITEAIHWDLYNRTAAPDITLFHGGGRSVSQVAQSHLTGKYPIFSGFSQSPHLTKALRWGSTVLATPTAVRHIVLSHYQGLALGGEKEVAVGVRMKLDERSVVFNSSSFGVEEPKARAALHKFVHGSDHKTVSGEMIEELRAVWAGHGTIPIPEEAPGIAPKGTAEAQYEKLPAATAKEAGEMAHTLKYQSEDGSKEAAIGKIDGMGLVAGDFIEGLKGTRYVIIADGGDSANGLRYVKIDPATKLPDYNKSYHFSASAGNDFYRLLGKVEIPKVKKVGFVPFGDKQYAALVPDKPKPMLDFTAGEMLKVEGEGYKVVAPEPGTNRVEITSLDTGKQYTIAGLFKGTPLIPSEDYVPPTPEIDFTPFHGQHLLANGGASDGFIVIYSGPDDDGKHRVHTSKGGLMTLDLSELTPAEFQPESKAEPGDKFSHEGKPYTVTSVLKSGIIRAKPSDGPVEKFNPPGQVDDKLPTATGLLRLQQLSHGDKRKGKDLLAGELVSAGTGNKIRPYLVTATGNPKTIVVKNLETGEVSSVSKNKSWRMVEAPDPPEVVKDPEAHKPPKPETTLPPDVPDKKVPFSSLSPGDHIVLFKEYDNIYEVVDPSSGELKEVLKDGGYKPVAVPLSDSNQPVFLLKPHPAVPGKFDKSQYVEGMENAPHAMEVGDLFLSATGLPLQLKSKQPKGGATAVALHNGKLIKNLPYDKLYTTLEAKPEAPTIPYEQLSPGDVTTLSTLQVGDQYSWKDGMNTVQIMEIPDEPDQHVKISSVLDDGALHPTVSITALSSDEPVVYQGKASPPISTPEPEMVTVPGTNIEVPKPADTADLPYAGTAGFEAYKHHKSGTAKHSHVGDLADGTQFVGKDGGVWIKKGGTGDGISIVSNGETHYGILNSEWVKPEDQVKGGLHLIDGAGPMNDEGEKTQAEQLQDSMLENDDTLEFLNVQPGDLISGTTNAGVWSIFKIVSVDGELETVIGEDVDGGGQANFSKTWVPTLYKPEGQGSAQVFPGEQMPPTAATDLEVGDTFHFEPTPGVHSPQGWVVKSVKPAGSATAGNFIQVENPESGGTWEGETGNLGPGVGQDPYTLGGTVFGVTKGPPPAASEKMMGGPPSPKLDLPHTTGEKVTKADMEPFDLALSPQGKFVYKTQHGGLMYVGEDKSYKPKAATQLTPVFLRGVSTEGYEDGETTTLAVIEPGDFFEINGQDYYTLGKSDKGLNAVKLDDGKVFWQSASSSGWDDKVVTRREPPGGPPPSVTEMPDPDDLASIIDELPEATPESYPSNFAKDPDTGEYPPGVTTLGNLSAGQQFTDSEGAVFRKLHDGPVQSSVMITDGEVKFQMDVGQSVKPAGEPKKVAITSLKPGNTFKITNSPHEKQIMSVDGDTVIVAPVLATGGLGEPYNWFQHTLTPNVIPTGGTPEPEGTDVDAPGAVADSVLFEIEGGDELPESLWPKAAAEVAKLLDDDYELGSMKFFKVPDAGNWRISAEEPAAGNPTAMNSVSIPLGYAEEDEATPQDTELSVPFTELEIGAYFGAHFGIWQKVTGGAPHQANAKLVAKTSDGKQMADIGEQFPGWGETDTVSPAVKKNLIDMEEGDHYMLANTAQVYRVMGEVAPNGYVNAEIVAGAEQKDLGKTVMVAPDVEGYMVPDPFEVSYSDEASEFPDATTVFNALANGDIVPTKKGVATITDNQIPGDGIMSDLGELKWHDITGYLGHTEPGGPAPVNMGAAYTPPAAKDKPVMEFVAFEAVPVGYRFWHQDAIWEKVGLNAAELTEPKGEKPAGFQSQFLGGESVAVEYGNPAHPEHPEEIKASELAPGQAFVHGPDYLSSGKISTSSVYVVTGKPGKNPDWLEMVAHPSGGGFSGGGHTGQVNPEVGVIPFRAPSWYAGPSEDSDPLEDAMNAPTWPEDSPLPEKGDVVKYVSYDDGQIHVGWVSAVHDMIDGYIGGDILFNIVPADTPDVDENGEDLSQELGLEDLAGPVEKVKASSLPEGAIFIPDLGSSENKYKVIIAGETARVLNDDGTTGKPLHMTPTDYDAFPISVPESETITMGATPESIEADFELGDELKVHYSHPGGADFGEPLETPADVHDYSMDIWIDLLNDLSQKLLNFHPVADGDDEEAFHQADELFLELKDHEAKLAGDSWNGMVVDARKIAKDAGYPVADESNVPAGTATGNPPLSGEHASTDAFGHADALPSQLDPYLHPKSGSNKYDKIGTLIVGTEFTDKKKGKYRIVGKVGATMIYEDLDTGKQYQAPKKDRVKVVKVPVEEMRWRFTTGGTVKLLT